MIGLHIALRCRVAQRAFLRGIGFSKWDAAVILHEVAILRGLGPEQGAP